MFAIALTNAILFTALATTTPDVAPAQTVDVTDTPMKFALSSEGPALFLTPSGKVIPPGALAEHSIVVKHKGQTLTPGIDYQVAEKNWNWTLTRLPDATVPNGDKVDVSYNYSLLRLDSRIKLANGDIVLRQGTPEVTIPKPVNLQPGETRLANIFINYYDDGADSQVFIVNQTADQAKTHTTVNRIPKTMAKIQSGKPVKIVTWGDSVTAGGDASSPDLAYPKLFEKQLHEKFPQARITVENVSVGGSFSNLWINPEAYPQYTSMPRFSKAQWQRVVDAQPDLVTIEFVNDASYNRDTVYEVYGEIMDRLNAIGAEVILITPHFTSFERMGFADHSYADAVEIRKYVLALIEFANEFELAIADASSRWAHLYQEGIPYTTLLGNGFNHPDDHGHRIFAEELMKNFSQQPDE